MTTAWGAAAAVNQAPVQPLHLKRVLGTEINMPVLVLGERRMQWVAKCSNHWAKPGRIFEKQTALEPGWDGTMKDHDIPGQRKIPLTYHSLVLGYPISDYRMSFIDLVYPIPGFFKLGISRGYPQKGLKR
jgi:hypothetical protein